MHLCDSKKGILKPKNDLVFRLMPQLVAFYFGLTPVCESHILKMANANPLWGAPRIHGELLKLGSTISEGTVSNLMYRQVPKPPSQT